MHPHWNSTKPPVPTTEQHVAALAEAVERLGDHLRQAEKKIAALEAKLQAREPIGRPAQGIDACMDPNWKPRIDAKQMHIDELLREAAKNGLHGEFKPVPGVKYEARGYVDPNRPDQAKAVVLPTGVKVTGVSDTVGSFNELINKFWADSTK